MKEGWGWTRHGVYAHYFIGEKSLCGHKLHGKLVKDGVHPGNVAVGCTVCHAALRRRGKK